MNDPYRPPVAAVQDPSGSEGVWRSGSKLVLGNDSACPRRCVLCGSDEVREQPEVTFQYIPRWVILLALIATLIFVIAYALVRKVSKVRLPLCREHAEARASRKKLGLLLIAGSVAGGFGLFVLAVALNWPIVVALAALVGVVGLVAGLVVWGKANSILTVDKITKTHTWLKGAHPDFLEPLPSLVE